MITGLTSCDWFGDKPKGVDYEVKLTGVPEGDLRQALEDSSDLIAERKKAPANDVALRARVTADVERLKKAMASRGFYDGKVETRIDETALPVGITMIADPGEVYTLASAKIVTATGAALPLSAKLAPEMVGLELGKPALARAVLDAQGKILKVFTTGGFPLAVVSAPVSVIDVATHAMRVTYTVDPGGFAWFGLTSITGLTDLDPTYVENRLKWNAGADYDSTPVDATKQALVGTGLFSTVNIHPAAEVDADGSIPMIVDAAERDKHSVGATAEYSTSQAILANVFWEDRNLFGDAEKLRLSAEVGNQEKNAIATLALPDVGRPDQSLKITGGLSDETVDPYSSRKVFAEVDLERTLFAHVTASVGVGGAHANLSTDMGGQHYDLATVPLSLKFDDSNDLLNPVHGYRVTLDLTPSLGESNFGALRFVTADARATAYQSLSERGGLVTAEFVRFGSIQGVAFGDLPRDLRFYSGGGGSLRGYAFQHAGPIDADGNPIGGKSVFESGAELRIPVWKNIDIVPFAEAGSYYETPIPDFSRTLLYDGGMGARYMTPLGPLRLDIAVPLRKRSTDGSIQIYASIGQAF